MRHLRRGSRAATATAKQTNAIDPNTKIENKSIIPMNPSAAPPGPGGCDGSRVNCTMSTIGETVMTAETIPPSPARIPIVFMSMPAIFL